MKALTLILSLFLAFSMTACSDSESKQETAQSQAESLVDRQNSLARQINAMGTPSSFWSNEKLDKYEDLVDQLESVEKDLGNYNGTNGITITGNNKFRIPMMRSRLASARSLKSASSVSVTPVIPSVPVGPKEEKVEEDGQVKADRERIKELENISKDYENAYGYSSLKYDDFYMMDINELEERIPLMEEHKMELEELTSLYDDEIARYRAKKKIAANGTLQHSLNQIAESLIFATSVQKMAANSDITSLDFDISSAKRALKKRQEEVEIQAQVP